MAVYPSNVRAFTTHVDLSESVFALHVNDLQDELVAVQTELGILPKGTYPSVRTRLDGLASGKADAGHDHTNRLDNVTHDVTGRHLYGSALGTPGAPSTWAVGAAAVVGVDASPAHGDHAHPVPAQAAIIDQIIPAGVIWAYGGTTLPAGNWAWCDGASLVRTAPYVNLFAAIGTRYGNVDGTHFNVPNFLSRAPMGGATTGAAVSSGGFADAAVITHGHAGSDVVAGSADHQHYVQHGHNVPAQGSHRHTIGGLDGFNIGFRTDAAANGHVSGGYERETYTNMDQAGSHGHYTDGMDTRWYSDGATNSGAYHDHGITIAGADGAVSGTNRNLPPFQTCNFIIKF